MSAATVAPLRARIRNVAAASAVALVVSELISLVQTVALARLLSPREVGLFVAGGVFTTFVGNFVEGGLRSALVQRQPPVDDAAATVFWATLGAGLLMALVSLAAVPVIAAVFDSRTAGTVAAAMSGGLLLYSLTNVPEALLQREFSVRRRLIVGPLVSVTFAVTAVTLAVAGWGVWSLVVGSYVSSVVWVGLLWALCRWRPWRGRPSFRLWREMAAFGFPLVLNFIADRVQKTVQSVVTGAALGTAALGLQRYGERIARIPVAALIEGGSNSLLPAFASLAPDVERLRAAYLRALRLAVAVAAAASVLILAVGEPLVLAVLGEKWRGAAVVVLAMSPLALGKAVTIVGEEAIKGLGRTRVLNWYTLTETSVGIGLLLALVPTVGLAGVGLSISLTSLVVGAVVARLAVPVVGVSVPQTTSAIARPLGAAALCGAVVVPLGRLVVVQPGDSPWKPLLWVMLDVLLFTVLYLVALRLLAAATFRDVRLLASDVLVRRRRPRTPPRAVATSDDQPNGGPIRD